MRKIATKLLAATLTASLLLGFSPASRADDDKPPAEKSGELPLRKVVMFSSGVGYFERRGDVTDNAKVDLKFNVRDVNDLLKSMVLQDLGGGQIFLQRDLVAALAVDLHGERDGVLCDEFGQGPGPGGQYV